MEVNKGFFVRLDSREGYLQKIQMLIAVDDYVSIIGVKHNGISGENPHYHMIIQTTIKQDALRKRFKQIFTEGKGNGHMSIKVWDGNIDAIAYMFHEDESAELIVRKNIDNELIETARKRNADVKDKVAQAKEKASWKLEEVVFQELKEKGVKEINEYEIAKIIILKALRSDKYVPNDFLLRSMASKIQFRLYDGDVDKEEEFATNYADRVYRFYGRG